MKPVSLLSLMIASLMLAVVPSLKGQEKPKKPRGKTEKTTPSQAPKKVPTVTGPVTLAWDHDGGANTKFRLYQRSHTRLRGEWAWTKIAEVKKKSHTLRLPPGGYIIACRAVGPDGKEESPNSNEIAFIVAEAPAPERRAKR